MGVVGSDASQLLSSLLYSDLIAAAHLTTHTHSGGFLFASLTRGVIVLHDLSSLLLFH